MRNKVMVTHPCSQSDGGDIISGIELEGQHAVKYYLREIFVEMLLDVCKEQDGC